ncbi:MAG TPA: carboxypeptidase-like regulatory domain-containing protein [Bryobacteraceae bacterium]|nr:carboxypeptidase-like regulatory domain-containing protein [Bryobacteraceae bacterium]
MLFALIAAAQTDPTGSVSGVVTDAVTHIPVRKAMVTISPAGNFAKPVAPQSTMTDASGAFTINALQAGQYRLMFQHPNYPQARFGGVSKFVEIKAGEAAASLSVELIPGAAVSGHVSDEDGDPLSNCPVQIHPAKNSEQGVAMMGGSGSNLEGEYRLFGIPPGKYILSAQCGHAVFQPRPFSAGPDPAPTKAYSVQYYPAATEPKGAQPVELTAGNEKSGIDFQMTPTVITQVRGAFAPGGADWRNVQMIAQLSLLGEHLMNSGVVGSAVDQAKGTFEFRQVFPGSYMLAVFSQGGNEENRIGAWQRIDVGDKPVDLVLELKRAIDLSGKLEIESSGNTTNKITPSQINIQLVPRSQIGMPGSVILANDDGTFTLKGVLPAPWRLQVNGPMTFIKSVWLGSVDVTNAPLDLSGGAVGALKIVVSTNTATIRGTAPPGDSVFAMRVDDDSNHGARAGTGVDQNGQYSLGGLAPGKYRLVVTEPGGGPMPDEGGQEITVREGETVMADLKAPSGQ